MAGEPRQDLPNVTFYASSRRLPALFAVALLVAVLPALLSVSIGAPDVIGSGSGSVISLSTLMPYLLALTFTWALIARRTHLSDNAVRRTEPLDSALLLILNLVVLLLVTVIPDGDLATSRNAAVLTGAAAVLISISSPAAASAVVTFFVLFIVTYGQSAPASRFVRVLQAPSDNHIALAIAVAALLVGSGLLARPRWSRT